jgi:hypothetical protein
VRVGHVLRMKEEDQRLIDEARRSREATEELREEGSADEADEGEEQDQAGNHADSVSEDD